MSAKPQPPNIYIVGAQCTGKTTLVNNLKRRLVENPPVIISEVARTVLKQHHFTAADVVRPARSLELQRLILKAQSKAERRAVDEGRWFVSDRSGADPIAYALRYVGGPKVEELIGSSEWVELRDRMRRSVVVVCEGGEAMRSWLDDDGVRLMPRDVKDWVEFHNLFCGFLDSQEIRYAVLPAETSGHEDRCDFVLGCWRELDSQTQS